MFALPVFSIIFFLLFSEVTLAGTVQCEYIPRDSSQHILYFADTDAGHQPWSKEMDEAACLAICSSEVSFGLKYQCVDHGFGSVISQDPPGCDATHTTCGPTDSPTLTVKCKFTPKKSDGSTRDGSWERLTPSESDCQKLCDDAIAVCAPSASFCGGIAGGICCDREKSTCEKKSAFAEPAAPYTFVSTTPNLEIPLPTLGAFADITIQGDAPNRYLLIPWLGQYIAAIYKYAIGIVGILSGIMIVIGGLLWLTAGGDAGKVSTAKSFIESSLVGLVIALTSYLLLYAINPKLTEFDSLRVNYIERVEDPIASSAASLAEDLPQDALTSGNHSAFITPEQYKLATGKDMPSKSDIIAMMDRIAQTKDIDKCLLDAIVAKESGYKPNRIGHDEDVARTQVGARRKFIDSGKKYSGATFTPNTDLYTQSFPNDDVFDPQSPPNFGLDVRFTHGIGLGQMTIIDEDHNGEIDRCPDGNIGREVGGTCLNVLELFDAEKTLEASADLIKKKLARFGSVERLFYRYAGGGCSARVSQCKKMKAYAECKGDSNLASKEREDCMSWLRENSDNCDNKDFR